MASKGIMNETITRMKRKFFPGKLSLAKVKPASDEMKSPHTTTAAATNTVLPIARGKLVPVKSAVYASKVNGDGIKVRHVNGTTSAKIAFSGFNDEATAHKNGVT